MTAIITDKLRRTFIDILVDNILGSSDNYYIAVGRSEVWNDSDIDPTPLNSDEDIEKFRHSMQSIKSAENVSRSVPRVNWSTGTIYQGYDDASVGHPTIPFYVITDEFNVYVCVDGAKNADGTRKISTIKPTGQSTNIVTLADGYTWKFLYSIPTNTAVRYLSSNFMPVKLVDSADAAVDFSDDIQYSVQTNAIDGQVLNFRVDEGGSGYTSAPTVEITGDGVGAAGTATINTSTGEVVKVDVTSRGTGYGKISVKLTGGGGSGASVRGVLSPNGGLGSNPIIDLKSTALMFNVKPSGTESGNWIVNNDFRQVAILKNPEAYNGSLFTDEIGLALKKFRMNSISDASDFEFDQEITGTISQSKAIIDYIDSDTIYFHQTLETGFGSFDSDVGSTITGVGSSGVIAEIIDNTNDVNNLSGEILYLENRAPILRDAQQTEDIKVILQL